MSDQAHATYAGPIIEGYLFCKGYFGDWRSRYVELHNDVIVYRFVKGGMEWGRMEIRSRTKCEDNSDRHFCFLLSDPVTKERLFLAALNMSLKEAWTEAIQNLLTSKRIAERKLKYGDHHKLVADEQQNPHKVYVRIIQARNLLAKDNQGFSDPYVKVSMGAATARTTTRRKNLNPDWGMVFPFSWDSSMRYVRIEVWDEELKSGDRFLGMVLLPVLNLKDGDSFTAWYPLGKRSTRSTVGGDIEVELACTGMPDRDSKAWRLFYQIQQLPDLTINLSATADGNGQIALDYDGIKIARKDKTGQHRCLVGDTDSVSSDEGGDVDDEDPHDAQPASNMLHGFPLHFPPIELEKLEDFSLRVHLKCVVGTAKFSCAGLLMLTNYRVIFLPNTRVAQVSTSDLAGTRGRSISDAHSQSRSVTANTATPSYLLNKREIDLSTQVPIASIMDVSFTTDMEDSGPHVGATFETLRIVTTDCRTLVFHFVEDVDGLSNRHLNFINKTFGNILRGVNDNLRGVVGEKIHGAVGDNLRAVGDNLRAVGDNVAVVREKIHGVVGDNLRAVGDNLRAVGDNVADNLARKKASLVHDIQNLNAVIVKSFTGVDSREPTQVSFSANGSESDLRNSVAEGGDESSPKTASGGSRKPSPTPQDARSRNATVAQLGLIAPGKLEKCWLRLIKENINEVEALDSEEGTPGQRFLYRLRSRVINRASEKSTVINTNMSLLHTLRTACGQNPSAPQYFFHSIAEYDAVVVAGRRLASTAADDSQHAPSMLPMGWTSSDQISDLADPNAGPTKAERLREECTTYALVKKIRDFEPLHNVYTKLLYNVENSWLMYDPHNEFKRMGVPNSMWRISYANVQYELCDTYPAVLAFPKSVDDESLIAAAPFRSKQRLPTLSWRSTTNNATISRSSQPMVGLGLSRNSADEFLLREISRASLPASDDLTVSFGARSNPSVVDSSFTGLQMSEKSVSSINTIPLVQAAPRRYVITDARPLLNARANQAAGKGVESDKNYENCSVVFLDIGNIHAMRKSLEMMVEANCSDDANWLRNAEAAGWLGHVRKVLLGAAKIAHFLAYENLSVLVHCSDGWDRTSQLTSLSMLMMDGYYRTLRGFIVLIEKEWLSFGHKFADRQGWTSEGFVDEERSPIFAQFLDCVHQFLVQMPDAFEFNENLLLFLVTHLYSGWFGNFLFNSEYELKFHVSHKALLSIWTVVLGNKEYYKNPRYAARESPVVPVVSKSKLVIWHGWFLNWQDKIWNASWMETNQLDVKNEARVIDGKTCFKCEAVFTFTRRKHHCRCCAQIFCYDCCNARRIVPSVSTSYKSRCCNECALLLDMDYFNETETTRTKTQPTAYGNSNFRASLTQKPLLT